MSKEVMQKALDALESMAKTLAEHEEQTTFNEDEAMNALREALAEQPAPVQQELVQADWRKLALQFDAQRMSALAHLRMMVQDPSKHIEVAREFLAAAPAASEAIEQPAQPQQEPVAWATRMGEYAHIHWGAKRPEYPMVYEVPLYTSPPAQQEPVAVVSGYYGGQCVILPIDPARIFNSNTPLYAAPQPCPTCEALARTVMLDQTSHDALRKPLTDEELIDVAFKSGLNGLNTHGYAFARAIEAAHGIREKNT